MRGFVGKLWIAYPWGSAHAFSKLSRYEAAIERRLYLGTARTLTLAISARGAAGAAGGAPPPLTVSVDVSGIPEGDG